MKLNILLTAFLVFLINSETWMQVVAEFGSNKITLDEFKVAYLDIIKKPNVFDSRELRENFLDELIASRLLAQTAINQGLDNNMYIENKVNAYQEYIMRGMHYDTVVKSKIEISDSDVEECYVFSQEKRRISHLFTEQKVKIDSIYNLLKTGGSFDEIAKELFSDTLLSNNGGDLGWVEWEQLDFDLAQTAFILPLNVFSSPIKSQHGYHIIKITDFQKKPMITRQEYELNKRKTRYLIQYKIGEKESYNYIDKLLKNAKVIIYPQIIEFLEKNIRNKFQRKPNQAESLGEFQLRDYEIQDVESNLWDSRDQVLANINGKKFTIGNFIGLLNFIDYSTIYSSFRITFNTAIRDYLIIQEAYNLGLDQTSTVKMKTNLYKEFLLQKEYRQIILSKVKVDEEEVIKLYETKKSNFKQVPYEEMKEILKEFIRNRKRREAIPSYVNSIVNKMAVTKNTDLIHSYYDSIYLRNN